ncbi:YcaO-like family protein [uncultured Sphingomonas sp.]|uniref:YcaO-like family protein n=1 Tax=uncultured Sphingomonas sp. TaxID=158754 RepID=UPI0035C9B186
MTAARAAAIRAGVTRLGDVTGLGGLGVPTFQAVRPWSRSLTVSQGKGLTPMAAMVSALLEAVEFDAAERLTAAGSKPAPLRDLGPDALACWAPRARDPQAIALDPDRPRPWLRGSDLLSGRAAVLPFDLLSLDFTRAPAPDVLPCSVGLATGNIPAEALAAGVAEVIEHHLTVELDRLPPAGRRRVELDLASVDCPLALRLLSRFGDHGWTVRVWSLGQEANVAAFACVLLPERGRRSGLTPAGGSGCHPDRRIALLRALLEAAQAQATLIAGARDDLRPDDYRDGPQRRFDLIMDGLSFGPGPLAWHRAPHAETDCAKADLEALLTVAERLSPMPVIAFAHPHLGPDLHVSHVVAPGLLEGARAERRGVDLRDRPGAPSVLRRRGRRPILFAGPSLPAGWRDERVELRPPAVCGDLAALLDDPPPAVGLVDGCFGIAPTVSHKELLELLAHGVAVLGGASLGAIRAAELAAFGMRGIGAIFLLYASGAVVRDDAVMLDHAPAELGHRPLTLALVDAEAALRVTPMPPDERRMLQRIVRTLSFRERTWRRCLDAYAERTGRRASVDDGVLVAALSLKEHDAALLASLLPGAGPGRAGGRPPPTGDHLRVLALNRARPTSLAEEVGDAPRP